MEFTERERLISAIVNHVTSQALGDEGFLLDAFMVGWRGYQDYSDEELLNEASNLGIDSEGGEI